MLLNILRIATSNVLKTFLNISASIGYVHLLMSIHTNRLEAQTRFKYGIYVRVNSSRKHPPPGIIRAFEKMFKCPALRVILLDKCPGSRSFCGGQMPGTPVHLITIKIISCHILINITVSAQ